MKTIEQVAFGRYLSDQSKPERFRMNTSNYLDWAYLGANEAQRWIPIDEELPEMHEVVSCKTEEFEDPISGYRNDKEWKAYFPFEDNYHIITPTHWRPFERK